MLPYFLLLTAFSRLIHALTEEFEFAAGERKFVVEGSYEKGHFTGEEFWICLDYDSYSREEAKLDSKMQLKKNFLSRMLRKRSGDSDGLFEPIPPNAYPPKECGGPMRATNNGFWWAMRGRWRSERVLEMRFVSAFEVWTESWTTNVKPVDHEFAWNKNVLKKRKHSWKLVQTHGFVKGRPRGELLRVGTADLIGSGRVNVLAPALQTPAVHVRVNGEGVRLKSLSLRVGTIADDFPLSYQELS
ncbi:hypothetical protein M3Y99_00035800 [Aphelenchoides fujianensis]|nr:hypothetical protein M3Y99_00035800 [Aphelenchoides fujianensis]